MQIECGDELQEQFYWGKSRTEKTCLRAGILQHMNSMGYRVKWSLNHLNLETIIFLMKVQMKEECITFYLSWTKR